ncbi:MAG: sulfite exporter TauE/SafE family protein [Bacteroidales bacterium]|jgi:uncharacterized membrane protein YfcA|nr:sulfite exporter TauE/SafE family protein [Bacteroidales bacterium]
MDIAFLIFLGIVGGLIAGMLGLGGGIFYILIFPYLIEARGFPSELTAQFAIANSLFGIMVASGMSLISYKRKGKFPIKEILTVGIASAIIAYFSLNFIVLQVWFSKIIFNIFIIILMIYILLKMYLELNLEKKENGKITVAQGIASGGIAGFVSALSGLGGGIIIIPLLTFRFKISLVKAKTISLAMIFISSLTMTINNLIVQPYQTIESVKTIGYIIPSCIIPITIGVLIGSPLGVKWSTSLKRKYLDLLFMVFVIIVLIEKSYGLISAAF